MTKILTACVALAMIASPARAYDNDTSEGATILLVYDKQCAKLPLSITRDAYTVLGVAGRSNMERLAAKVSNQFVAEGSLAWCERVKEKIDSMKWQ